jgi:hypothetical protein
MHLERRIERAGNSAKMRKDATLNLKADEVDADVIERGCVWLLLAT